jgi:hypothetical protein
VYLLEVIVLYLVLRFRFFWMTGHCPECGTQMLPPALAAEQTNKEEKVFSGTRVSSIYDFVMTRANPYSD